MQRTFFIQTSEVLDDVDDDLYDEEQSYDVCSDRDLLSLSCKNLDDYIGKDTEHDTVRDGVCTYHHQKTQEGWNTFCWI